jgi:hypothetical protein
MIDEKFNSWWMSFGEVSRNIGRKLAFVSLLPPKIPHKLT